MKPEIVEVIARCVCGMAQGAEDNWKYYIDDAETICLTIEQQDEYKALVADAEAHRAHMAFISPYRKEPLPDFGDRLPLRDRLPGGDGSAYWATDTHYYPRATERPDDATQILYFSKYWIHAINLAAARASHE